MKEPLSPTTRKLANLIRHAPSIYNFFDLEQDFHTETSFLLTLGIPPNIASRISKINNHDKSLGMLGILPNQLKELLKVQNPSLCDAAFEDFSKEIFWNGCDKGMSSRKPWP